ncbi:MULTISPECIES: bifunctional NAD(P)/FAD-dependent oxidoreductase/class I SAM-dependent methyltransferase [Pseudonocardia]|uniref:Thioredoxin reductase n=2 Tax=Pseudonocardia TaxID=1847 RepID=A0A1Y2N254_PSEAH|nr:MULTISPECIES: bifunctional NAD(P)/FAD-dependent oxidoreductase/class I SAM-dependent methyltransferase [Pseudonocardia]OSY41546.1 Thioredoxin reductase [Pseudonocardia autotrophica]TDN71501.1 thioredoxin reductase [Pseudonocardia autotrophica]
MTSYDVIVIGGGAAGLSAALTLSRARWQVLVLDDGTPRNAPAEGVHNWLTRDGLPPAEIGRIGRAEVTGYGGTVRDARVRSAVADPSGGFGVSTADGDRFTGRRLLVTTGLSDELPDLDGLAGHWGGAVFGCPFCHAWEYRDTRIGVLSTGPHDLMKAQLLTRWTDAVTLFLHTGPQPDDGQRAGFAARGITVVEGPVAGVESDGGRLTGVRLTTGDVVACDALTVSPPARARAGFLDGLGLATVEHPSGLGDHLPADPTGATTVPGVYAAGNVTDPMATVPLAVAAGVTAGAAITRDLVADDVARAVADARQPDQHQHQHQHRDAGVDMWSAGFWDAHYGTREHLWSGNPNRWLVTDAAELQPGRALDAGCGEGADAIWLAARGWQVTGTDVSQVALDRAGSAAREAGQADRIRLEAADLRGDELPERAFDLVTAQYLHLPAELRRTVYARLAEAVAPGGTLLLVAHHPKDLEGPLRRPHDRDLFADELELAAELDDAEWEVQVAQARPHPVPHPDGHEVTAYDTVVRARRRA